MTDNQRRLVFEYCGWKEPLAFDRPYTFSIERHRLDSNDMTSAMNLMVEKGDWEKFVNYSCYLSNRDWMNLKPDSKFNFKPEYIWWLMQPGRFFQLFGEWLEQREKEERGMNREPTRTKLGNNHEFVQYGKQCDHGQLARSCEICELEKEIADLRQQLEDEQVYYKSFVEHHETTMRDLDDWQARAEKAEAENAELRGMGVKAGEEIKHLRSCIVDQADKNIEIAELRERLAGVDEVYDLIKSDFSNCYNQQPFVKSDIIKANALIMWQAIKKCVE